MTLKKINDFLNSTPMMTVSGIFLLISLLNHVHFLGGFSFPLDPAWVSILICGLPLAYLAIERVIKERFVSSALLITIAMVAAIYIGEIFAAGEVAFIMAIGAWLEDRTLDKTHQGIEKLLKLVPNSARRITYSENGNSKEENIDASELGIGDIIRVLPGESIPADGKIIVGNTSVDQSVMTGESLPVDKIVDDEVFSGTINLFGSIDVNVSKSFENSSLQKLIALVKEAEKNKAPLQKIVDRVAKWLVPLALIIAILTYFISSSILGDSQAALVRAVTVLVVFCPCALTLATPTSVVAAIGQATKYGVLIKSGEALEEMGKITKIAFDKTGTLTNGKLSVTDIIPFSSDRDSLLVSAASVEKRSEHPLGKAIVKYAKTENVSLSEVVDFNLFVGKGISGYVNGQKIICGNEKLISELSKAQISSGIHNEIEQLRTQGKAIIIVADEENLLGMIALSDTLKTNSAEAIEKLKKIGIKDVLLLTGDNEMTAKHIAEKVGITKIHASLLPEDKVKEIKKIMDEEHSICMVGDGVNDAPALKTASVSIAMGTMGSDVAIDAADIALMGDDISKVSYIKRLSNATVKTIKFNIAASMIINIVAIILSVLGLLTPVTGALVHNAGSVLVVLNAALLYDRKYEV